MKLVKKDKKHYKNIYIYCILITLDTLQLKKLMIVKVFTV